MCKINFLPPSVCFLFLLVGCGPRDKTSISDQMADNNANTSADENLSDRVRIERLLYEIPKSFANEDYENFPTTMIKIVKPEGFSVAERFVGFFDEANDASVMLNISPMPFKKEMREQIFSAFAISNINELYSKDLEINGRKGMYVYAHQALRTLDGNEIVFGKHMVTFGDEKNSWVISGSFPLAKLDELSAKVLTSVMSAQPVDGEIPLPGLDLNFEIDESENMKFNRGWAKKIVLTKNGEFPMENISDPFVKFEPALNPSAVPENDRLQFARNQLLVVPTIEVIRISAENPVTIDGLEGYEILAIGNELSTSTPMVLFVGILFDGDNYYKMNAWYGSDNVDIDYLEDFKSIFRSFSRK